MRAFVVSVALTLGLSVLGCSPAPSRNTPPPDPEEEGGASGSGTGGSGTGGATGGSPGTGGKPGTGGSVGTGGSPADAEAPTPPADAGVSADGPASGGPDGGGADLPASAPGQGPVAEGKIAYSQDFETGMDGIARSPNGLPADRAMITDDPLKQRGKVMRVEWRAGDNFRTSGGTEPRSWISNRPGNEFRPGSKMSHAFGLQFTGTSTDYAFGQIISSGGPVWMLILEGGGTLTVFCNTCGGNTRHMQLQPDRWYDFRVDLDFNVGGDVNFFLNGQMFRQGKMNSTRGDIAHWDGGIYNRAAGTSGNKTRVVYISNLSVGVR
jgi:hypothetical protein